MKRAKVKKVHLVIIALFSAIITYAVFSIAILLYDQAKEDKQKEKELIEQIERREELQEYNRIHQKENIQKSTANKNHFVTVAEAINKNPCQYIPEFEKLFFQDFPYDDPSINNQEYYEKRMQYLLKGLLNWDEYTINEEESVKESFSIICDELKYSFRVDVSEYFLDEPYTVSFYLDSYHSHGILYFPDNISDYKKRALISGYTSLIGGTGEEITPNLYAYYQGLPYGV